MRSDNLDNSILILPYYVLLSLLVGRKQEIICKYYNVKVDSTDNFYAFWSRGNWQICVISICSIINIIHMFICFFTNSCMCVSVVILFNCCSQYDKKYILSYNAIEDNQYNKWHDNRFFNASVCCDFLGKSARFRL